MRRFLIFASGLLTRTPSSWPEWRSSVCFLTGVNDANKAPWLEGPSAEARCRRGNKDAASSCPQTPELVVWDQENVSINGNMESAPVLCPHPLLGDGLHLNLSVCAGQGQRSGQTLPTEEQRSQSKALERASFNRHLQARRSQSVCVCVSVDEARKWRS